MKRAEPPVSVRQRTRRATRVYLTHGAWLFLVFVFGAATRHFEVPPGTFLGEAFRAAEAVWKKRQAARNPHSWVFYGRARSATRGVAAYDREQAFGDYTLYLGSRPFEARLIDLEGNILHTWQPPYGQIRAAADDYFPTLDEGVYMRRAILYPNGDLLIILAVRNRTPWGLALVKLDRDSNVLWTYREAAHHDVCLAPDGRVFALIHTVVNEPVPGAPFEPPIVNDYVAVLSPDGREQQRLSIVHAIVGSEFRHVLRFASPRWRAGGDYLHINAIRYIDEDTAQRFSFTRPGQVLVASPNLDALIVLDLATQQATWMSLGFWRAGHDPDLLNNGNILLFDNQGVFGPSGSSRVVEIDPHTMAIAWEYRGTPEHPLESESRANQQRLANGNTFIVETNGGRLVEVTSRKEIVWEYYHPTRSGDAEEFIPTILWAERYGADELSPEFQQFLRSRSAR